MQVLARVGKNSLIYTTISVIQKAINFLLLPLYTYYLSPSDYGTLAIVTGINSFLGVFVTFSLHSAMNRYYFEYRHDPEKLKHFWGTCLTFVLINSIVYSLFLLWTGKYLLQPFIEGISFFPYVTLGLIAIMFQPVTTIFLATLQTREQSKKYGIISLSQFLLNLLLIVSFVVFLGWGVVGPLSAMVITSFLFFIVSLYLFRKDIKFGIDKKYLKEALRYSFPIIPHSLAAVTTSIADKILVNSLLSTTLAGIYSIGFLMGSVVNLITIGVNRAYIPVFMDILKKDDTDGIDNLKQSGLLIIVLYCLFASGISLFSKEIIMLFTTEIYYQSYIVVSYISFSCVISGVYFFFVNILFFMKSKTKFIPITTILGALLNIFLNLLMIPKFGIKGAAFATLSSQIIVTIIVGLIGRQFERVKWNYIKISIVILISGSISILTTNFEYTNLWAFLGIKIIIFLLIFFILNIIAWGNVFFLFERGVELLKHLKNRRKLSL